MARRQGQSGSGLYLSNGQPVPRFQDLSYFRPVEGSLENDLRPIQRQLQRSEDTPRMVQLLHDADTFVSSYMQDRNLVIALQRMRPGDSAIAEDAARNIPWPKMRRILASFYAPLLQRDDLSELAEETGDLLFLRTQNEHDTRPAHTDDLRDEEAELIRQWQQSPKPEQSESGSPFTWSADHLVLDSLYQELTAVRAEQVERLGFESIGDLCLRRRELFAVTLDELAQQRRMIIHWLVPITVALRERNAAGSGIRLTQLYPTLSSCNVSRDSMPNVLGRSQDQYRLNSVLESVLDLDSMRNWIELQNLGYVNFSVATRDAECVWLPETRVPLITGRLPFDSPHLPQLIQMAGEAIGLLNQRDSSRLTWSLLPTSLMRSLRGRGLFFLLLDHMEAIFAEQPQAERYASLMLEQSLYVLCYRCLLDEFQTACWTDEFLTTRRRRQLWKESVASVYPDLAAEADWLEASAEVWLSESELFERPYSTLPDTIGLLTGLSLWDMGREKPEEAVSAWKQLAETAVLGSPFNRWPEPLPDPLGPDIIKRLAYQLAVRLGL